MFNKTMKTESQSRTRRSSASVYNDAWTVDRIMNANVLFENARSLLEHLKTNESTVAC